KESNQERMARRKNRRGTGTKGIKNKGHSHRPKFE
ncbi:hypothetical protein QCI_2276, partial [Clostridioides difficile CD44]